MALKERDEEFKLPLRQWLIKKIDLKQFDGLEWEDKDKRSFKIPWTQKGHPNWEMHYQIFIAWAKHRGNYDEKNPPDDKKLKGNFRCALTKSDDFEEMKDYSKTDQQMGNYKVFKLLSPQEVKVAKREKRKRRHPKSSNNNSSPSSSLEMPKKLTAKVHYDNRTVSDYETRNGLCPSNQNEIVADINCIQPFTTHQPYINQPNIQLISTLPSPSLNVQTPSPLAYFDTQVLLSPEPTFTNYEPIHQAPSPDQPCQLQIQNFEQFLKKFNIPREKLSRFKITLFYERRQVLQETVDLSDGIRIMSGSNPERQLVILNVFGKNVTDIDLRPWIFPTYSGNNHHIHKILQSTDLGIALKTDSKNVLRGTRLCQSQVFYFENSNDTWQSKKMERQQPTELFSYLKYIRRLIQLQRDNVSDEVDCETTLVIGTKPNNSRSSTLVSVVLEPELSGLLKAHFKANDSLSLLAISQQTSLDELIRMLDGFDMRNL